MLLLVTTQIAGGGGESTQNQNLLESSNFKNLDSKNLENLNAKSTQNLESKSSQNKDSNSKDSIKNKINPSLIGHKDISKNTKTTQNTESIPKDFTPSNSYIFFDKLFSLFKPKLKNRFTRSGAFINDFRREVKENFELISNAISDKNGMGALNLMLHNTHVPRQHYDIFYKAYDFKEQNGSLVFIDCGVWAGQVTDIALHLGGVVYAFEPNKYLAALLRKKYAQNPNVFFYQKAVSNENAITKFAEYSTLSQGNTITTQARNDADSKTQYYDVEVIDLTEFIEREILSKFERIYLLKIDIEGAEFGLMDRLIDKGLHTKIKHIACETHERCYTDGTQKLQNLKDKIAKHNIKNILLDWV